MIEEKDIEQLKLVFVTREECDTITDKINKDLAAYTTEIALIKQKLDTITWLTRTILAAVLLAIVGAVMSLIL